MLELPCTFDLLQIQKKQNKFGFVLEINVKRYLYIYVHACYRWSTLNGYRKQCETICKDIGKGFLKRCFVGDRVVMISKVG